MLKDLKLKINKIFSTDASKIYLLSFLIPVILMLLIYILKGIFPFGERSFLRTDLYHQYAPFHSELLHKLQHFKSLFYTYDVGLGTNFISLMAYYLASPFNILLFFVNAKYVIEFLTYMTVFKIGLCGLTMAYYLVNKFKTEKYFVIFMAIFYAMSGYMAAYYWNVMWLDCIWLFPLLMLGVERLYFNKKPFLYIIVLALSILTNYYIAMMECFFLVIYFIFLIILSNDKSVKTILKKLLMFSIASIIAGLISSILLVPTIYSFFTTGSNKIDFPKSFSEYFSILDVFARQLPLAKIENGLDHWPNIYSGIMVFPLICLFYFNKKYKFKEKIAYTVLILFLIASFSINILAFFWHVMRFPNSLPSRQSFIYVFFILILCFKGLNKYKSVLKNEFYYSFVISILLVILLNDVVTNDKLVFMSFYSALIFLIIYFVLMYIDKNRVRTKDRTLFFVFVLLIVSTEAFINMYNTSITSIKRSDYMYKWDDIKTLNKKLDDITNDFYRVEMNNRLTKDDGAFFNYPSASIFSSSAYKEGTDFYKKVGLEASMNAYSITGSTPFMDSMLNVKYEFFKEKLDNPSALNMRLIDSTENVQLYQHLDVLPLSFVLTNKFIEKYDYSSGNPATVQNNFARALDSKIFLEKITTNINGKNADFTISEDGDYYLFIRDKSIEKIVVQYPTTSKTFDHIDRGFFAELGYLKKDEKYEVRNDSNDKELLIEVFKFNYDNLKEVNKKVMENASFKIIDFDDTHINYNLDVRNSGTCMISLPYDEGFSIYVDGKKADTKTVFDCFLGFDIGKGQHTINVVYIPKGFILGLSMTILGLISLLLFYYLYNNPDILKKSKVATDKNISIQNDTIRINNEEKDSGVIV